MRDGAFLGSGIVSKMDQGTGMWIYIHTEKVARCFSFPFFLEIKMFLAPI